MLSVRGVTTSIIRPDDFLCVWMSGSYSRGGDWGLALDISLWQSTKSQERLSWWCAHVGFLSVHCTSFFKSGKLNSGSYCGLSLGILGRANVIPRVNGLKVFHHHDALGDPGGMPQAPVDQPPGVLDRHGPFILLNDTHRHEGGWTRGYKQVPATQQGTMLSKDRSARPMAASHCTGIIIFSGMFFKAQSGISSSCWTLSALLFRKCKYIYICSYFRKEGKGRET